jgi:hypothetical protein
MGIVLKNNLFTYFPIFGIVLGTLQIRYWSISPKTKMHWWYEHINAMSFACIATVTASTIEAMPRLFPRFTPISPAIWIVPAVAPLPFLRYWLMKQRKKFGD